MVGILENTHVAYIKKDKHGQNYNKNLSKFIVFILFFSRGKNREMDEVNDKGLRVFKTPETSFPTLLLPSRQKSHRSYSSHHLSTLAQPHLPSCFPVIDPACLLP